MFKATPDVSNDFVITHIIRTDGLENRLHGKGSVSLATRAKLFVSKAVHRPLRFQVESVIMQQDTIATRDLTFQSHTHKPLD